MCRREADISQDSSNIMSLRSGPVGMVQVREAYSICDVMSCVSEGRGNCRS
jgi:hypothetical protein